MALSHKLELRQSQSLVMTPQLMQAIKLLQLSNLDLAAYVEAELERNPLLERGDDSADEPAERREQSDRAPTTVNGEEIAGFQAEAAEAVEAKSGIDLDNVFPDDPARPNEATPPPSPAETWAVPPSRQAVSSEDYNLE